MNIEMFKKLGIEEKNIYIMKSFKEFWLEKGCVEATSEAITSRVDKSVYLIGSAISVLKPYFLEERIPEKGIFLEQRAIRTQGLKNIYDNKTLTEWSPYFRALGVLMNYKDLENLSHNVWEYFNKKIGINKKDFLVRASSEDKDLIKYWESDTSNLPQIEFDTKPSTYYRHRYGLQDKGIYGRNVNLAIKDIKTGNFNDIGNIIVIESANKKFGVEAAFGVSNIISKIMSYKNSIEGDRIANIVPLNEIKEYRFADCITVVMHLLHENLKPTASDTKGRLLRQYLKALRYWSEELNISINKISEILKSYEVAEYGINLNIDTKIREYLYK